MTTINFNSGFTLKKKSPDIRKRLDEVVAIIETHLAPKYVVSYIVSEDGVTPVAAEPDLNRYQNDFTDEKQDSHPRYYKCVLAVTH